MATKGKQVATAAAAARLDTPDIGSEQIVVKNPAGASAAIFVGGAGVTSAGAGIGYALAAGESVRIDLRENDALYGASVAAQTAHVLESGV